MALTRKHIGKLALDTIDEWLSSTGYLFPENEIQLERFDKLYENYNFKLNESRIDVLAIIEGRLQKTKVIKLIDSDLKVEIDSLKMVARKGNSDLPKHIIDKMKENQKSKTDDKK